MKFCPDGHVGACAQLNRRVGESELFVAEVRRLQEVAVGSGFTHSRSDASSFWAKILRSC